MQSAFLFSIIIIGFIFFIFFSIITPLITVRRGEKSVKHPIAGYALFFSEIVYTVIGPAIGFMRFDQYGGDIPFAKNHVLIIIILAISSSASFWMAKLLSGTKNPFLRILISVGIIQGLILCGITTIHFLPFLMNGIMFPVLGFELLSPLIAFIFLFREFYFFNSNLQDIDELLPYRHELGFIPLPLKLLQQPMLKRAFIYSALSIPLITIQVMIAYGCGQDLDSLVKAYTHSHGFIFSTRN